MDIIALVSALISAAAAIVVCMINNHYQHIESDKKHEANILLISYKLEQLEKKVDVHNRVIERTYALEKRADVVDEQIKVANHRIEDLEKGDDIK